MGRDVPRQRGIGWQTPLGQDPQRLEVAQRSALIGAAHAASRSKGTYLSAQYARLKGRHGSKKAAVAVGHSILVICYHVLEREVPYEELGEDYFHRQRSGEAYAKRLVRQLELSRSQGSARTLTSIRLAGGRHSTGFSHQAVTFHALG
jgi:hypothetical protein